MNTILQLIKQTRISTQLNLPREEFEVRMKSHLGFQLRSLGAPEKINR